MEGVEDGQFDEADDVTYVELLLRYNALFITRKHLQEYGCAGLLSVSRSHVAVLTCSQEMMFLVLKTTSHTVLVQGAVVGCRNGNLSGYTKGMKFHD
jgi:hypothetical protein